MKALSIIGIVASSLSTIVAFKIADPESTRTPGIFLMIASLFFLAFSIVTLSKSSKKKDVQ